MRKGFRILGIYLLPLAAGIVNGQGSAPQIDVTKLSEYVGAYRVSAAETMTICHFQHGGRELFLFTDYAAGWRGLLQPASLDTFDVLERDQTLRPADPKIVLGKTGDSLSIRLVLPNGKSRTGTRVAIREEDIAFSNGDVTLSGSLVLPPTAGPYPAVIFVHGSGAATRDDYREWSYYFAANGIATLMYDKRGAGRSTGDYQTAKFEDLAADVLAAVCFLRQWNDIRPREIGISGGSQGGWVAPLAASLDRGIAFVIVSGGGPITPAKQEIYRRVRLVQDAGYSKDDCRTALSVVENYFEYLHTNGAARAADVSRAWREYAGEKWFALLDLPKSDPTVGEWPEGRRRFQRELFFDPLPSYKLLRCPVLFVLGADDQTFPISDVINEIHKSLPRKSVSATLIPKADHALFVARNSKKTRHQAPELFSRTLAWMFRQLNKARTAETSSDDGKTRTSVWDEIYVR